MPKRETSLINLLFQRNFFKNLNVSSIKLGIVSGADSEILKRGGALCLRLSKKAKTAPETINFWQNIFISIFKLSPFLNTIKVCR